VRDLACFCFKLDLFCADSFEFSAYADFLQFNVVIPFIFLQDTVITATTAVTLPVFSRILSILSSLDPSGSLWANLVTLIGRVVVDKKLTPFGLSNLRRLSQLSPVSPDQNSYSLSESLLALYARILRFLLVAAFFWPF
jgi:hypothetical protein